jgi:hypothetical protein
MHLLVDPVQSGTLVTLGPGTYTVTLSVGFRVTSFIGDCTGTVGTTATGTISADEHQTCTIKTTD